MHCEEQLAWLEQCPEQKRPHIWLKVDSGMHRLGFALSDIESITNRYRHLLSEQTVIATHFACADDVDNSFTKSQLAAFTQVVDKLGLPTSVANSPATVNWPASRNAWNRLGVGVYGGAVSTSQNVDVEIYPAMTLRSSVLAVRTVAAGEGIGYGQTWVASQPSKIATVGIGYADGYPRHCKNGTPVMIRGKRAYLAGRVSMDMITIDVTHIDNVAVGDEVELWGQNISIQEVADNADTIDYELMTRVSQRVPRIVKYL